jgi:2-hydroxy-4-carboxymuconate semialdehyde hemiacetal dehydrogenase
MTGAERSSGVGVAILGYGAIADMHAVALLSNGARLVVVAGPNPTEAAEFAARHGVEAVMTDPLRAIEADGVEAVVLASPSTVHATQAAAAIAAGKHVLVEIPLALCAADAEALVAQAAAAQRTLMVCHTLRYWTPFHAVRVAMDAAGWQPRNIVARGLARRRENVGWTGRRRSWTDDLLWHHGGHIVDMVLELLGTPIVDVSAEVGPVWEGSGLPMDYAIALRTADGAVATIALSYNARLGSSDYVIIGEPDTILIKGADVTSADGPIVAGEDVDAVQERAVLAQDLDFLECVRSGRRPVADAASILPAMRVLEAVQERVGPREPALAGARPS